MIKCKYCDIDMIKGYVLYPWYSYGMFSIASIGYANELKLVWKCSKCGHSEEIEK